MSSRIGLCASGGSRTPTRSNYRPPRPLLMSFACIRSYHPHGLCSFFAMVKKSQTKSIIFCVPGRDHHSQSRCVAPACIRISDTIHQIPPAFHAFVLQKCSKSLPRKNLSCLPVRRCPVFMSPRSLYLRSVPRLIPSISAALPIGYRPVRLTTGSFIDIAILSGLPAVLGLVRRITPTQIRPDYLVIFPVLK